jgi:hypothetical protein
VINEFAEEVENEVAVSLDELENLQAVSVEECSSILIKLQRAWMVLGKAHCTCCRIALSKSGMKPPSAGIYYYFLGIVCYRELTPDTDDGVDNSVRVIKKLFVGFQEVQSSKTGHSGGRSCNLGTYLTTPLRLRNSYPSKALRRPELT